jgi:hypothetical protein
MAGGQDGDIQTTLAGKTNGFGDVAGRRSHHHDGRVLVDDDVPGKTALIIAVVLGEKDRAAYAISQITHSLRV